MLIIQRTAAAILAAVLVSALTAQDSADPKDADSLREALFRLAKRFDPEVSLGPVRAQLDVYELELKERLAGVISPKARVRVVADYFFGPPLLASDKDLGNPDNFYIHRVLESRQGYCLSLSVLILTVTERLKLPFHGVASPRHFFLRYDDGTTRLNLETTERGAIQLDDSYRQRGIPVKAEAAGIYLRNLDRSAIIAHLLNNEGYVHWKAGRKSLAKTRFEEAIELHPLLIEARLNLAICHSESGDEKAAEIQFHHVLEYMPGDALTHFNRGLAAFRAGRFSEALEAIDFVALKEANDPYVQHVRETILAGIFQPETWKQFQADVLAKNEALRSGQKLAPGLRGAYYANAELSGEGATRIDPEINFEWRYNRPHPRIPEDHISIRWEGFIDLASAGTWTFLTVANDGVRVWVDGIRIIDNWKRNEGALDQQSLKLEAGLHTLRVDYFEAQAFAGITLQVKLSTQSKALPARAFSHRR